LPPTTASVPEVDCEAGALPTFVPDDVTAPVLFASPSAETALPPALTGAATGAVTWLPPTTASVPEVDCEAGALPTFVPDDVTAPVLFASPSAETALPPALTGAATGAVTWLPPAIESAPDVVDGEAAAVLPPEPAFVVLELLRESPVTEMALPLTVTGTDTGAEAWLPPPVESAPDVVDGEAAAPLPPEPAFVVLELLRESPVTEMALPPALTGAATGAVTWLPPAIESAPDVVDGEAAAVLPPEPAFVVLELLRESPVTEMALPPTVTGTDTGAEAWLPPPVESAPDVVDGEAAAPLPPEPAFVVLELLRESPVTEMALPPTVTGTDTGATT
ncbi:hypothetical protein, partial [Knoellia locipacati]|uniref:hypothetical protein n=1 Tax=Knoellia locipacati TaxID=882824 RepID=UPI0031E57DAF